MKICLFEPCEVGQFGGGYCKRHQYMRIDKPNKHQNKPVEPRSTIRPYKHTTSDKSELKTTKNSICFSWGYKSEMEMFKDIWQQREHKCLFTGSNLDLVPKYQFHWMFLHLLRKGSYRFFKYNPSNVVLGHPNFHVAADNFTEDERIKHPEWDFDKWFSLVEEQKQKYKDFLIANML